MHSRTAEQPLAVEEGTEALLNRANEQVAQEPGELPSTEAESAETQADAQDASMDSTTEENNTPPPADTEDFPAQAAAPSEAAPQEATPEDPAADGTAAEDTYLATPDPEAASAEAAGIPAQLLDPADDGSVKPASLSSQSEESIR